VLDSVHLEQMGIPSVVIVTAPFAEAAKVNARVQGMPDLPMIVIPHDYLEEHNAQVRAKVAPLVGGILERLFVRA
jgi:hypothetical protein